jgi:hypothetical protein
LLDVDEKAVFSARIFQHFSGIPCNFEDEPEDDEEESDLTTDEIELYKPLYDKLVNIEKVNIVAAKGSECQGENTSQTYKKALSATLKLNSEVSELLISKLLTLL